MFLTKLDSNVFVRIIAPKFRVGCRVRQNRKQNVPYNLEHVRLQEFPGKCVTHAEI